MWNLMKSELQRFWRLAVGFGIAVLLVLRAASAFGDLFGPSMPKAIIALLITAAGGLILGLYQIGTYKKVNQWAYLIHRPLAPGKILVALTGAAAVLLVLSLVVPVLLTVVLADAFTSEWIDTRHYLIPLFLLGIAMSFYLIGCFIRLSPSRAGWLVLILPTLFLTREATGLWVFVPMVVVLLWLGYLVYAAFKPDLSRPPERPMAIAATALAVQYALFLLLVAGSMLVYQTGLVFAEEGWKGYAVHAWDDHFARGTFLDTQYMPGKDALAHGLEAADTERSRHLRREIELAEVDLQRPSFSGFPVRHQLMVADANLSFQEKEKNILWTFSHDRMLFFGRDATSGVPVGWLGVSGPLEGVDDSSQRFPAVPYVLGERNFVTRRRLYEWAPDLRRVSLRFELPEGEGFASVFEHQGRLGGALTDRALYFFDPKDLDREEGLLSPRAQVELPGDVRNLESFQTAELIDGTLVSFLFGTQSERGFHEARQVLYELGADGSRELVASVPLAQGWPAWYRHRGFIASPALQTAHDLAWGAIAPRKRDRVTARDLIQRSTPLQIFALAFLVALMSALLTAWASRGRELSRGMRRAWIAAAFFLGLPAFLSLFLLTARSERAVAPARTFALSGLRRSAV